MKKSVLGVSMIVGLMAGCGKSTPSLSDLISKYNQYATCAGKATMPAATQAQTDGFNSACTESDRNNLAAGADCAVSIICNKADPKSCNPQVTPSAACQTFLTANAGQLNAGV